MRRSSILLLAVLLTGCGRGISTKASQAARTIDDPWQKAVSSLRRETDVESCRRILLDLNADLVKAPNAPQPSAMSATDQAATTADCGWGEAEAREISTSAYSALDAAYLAEVLYLRDVAAGLEVGSLPPARRANVAFEWVCRQVVPTEPQPNTPALPPLPATYVLRRGSGSGLERAYVFLELCRQLNVDAYFVGPPDAKDKPSKSGRDPFWAVGTRAGNQVLLFDPWAGQALPFNLEELRNASDKAVAWAKPLDLPPEALKSGELFLAIPLSAWAPRWKPLEERLEGERGAKLAANRETLLRNASNAAKGAPVGFWRAGGDPYSLPRTLAHVLSQLEGGFAPNGPEGRTPLYWEYYRRLLPGQNLFVVPEGIGFKELQDRILSLSIAVYNKSFLTPPMPRERFQRGQYQEASRFLVKEWEEYTKMVERDRGQADRQKAMNDWIERANRVYAEWNGAVNEAQRNAAQTAVNQFWKTEGKGLEQLAEHGLGPAGMGEAVYLLALCKQEYAERLSRSQSPEAAKEWQVAYDWWRRYRDFAAAQNRQYPGREAHAAALAARAGKMAGVEP
jgi:hypothetical protein